MTTARKIIGRALRLIEVLGSDEPGNPSEVVDGLDVLNTIWGGYSLGRLLLLSGINEDFPLTAGVSIYQIGPGLTFDSPRVSQLVDGSYVRWQNIDYAVGYFDQAGYNSIPFKDQPGVPTAIYFEPGIEGGTITVYPVPQYDMILHLSATLPFDQFADLDTEYALPPGYESALAYQLAVEVAPEYGKEASPTVVRMMMNYKRQIKRANTEVPLLSTGLHVQSYGWFGYPYWL